MLLSIDILVFQSKAENPNHNKNNLKKEDKVSKFTYSVVLKISNFEREAKTSLS